MIEALLLRPLGELPWNGLEILAVIVVSLIAWHQVCNRAPKGGHHSVTAFAIIAAVAITTASETTQFMTLDEGSISLQLLTPGNRAIRQLELGAFKSGATLLALPVVRAMEAFGAAPETIRMALKALWWTLGNVLVVWLAVLVARLALTRDAARHSALLVAIGYAGLTLLPTTQLALKTVNYDLLSMALGVLALVTAILAWRIGSWRLAGSSVLLAGFAAQEKLTGSAVLVGLIVLVAIAGAWSASSRAEAVRRAGLVVALAMLGVIALFAVTLVLYALLSYPTPTAGLWRGLLDPLATWSWMPLSLLMPITSVLDYRLVIALATAVALLIAAGIIAAFSAELRGLESALAGRSLPWGPIHIVLIALLFAGGMAGAMTINGYWAPYAPSALEGVMIAHKLNGVSLHVGATTLVGHVAQMLVYALAVTVVAVPTAVWGAGLVGSIAAYRCLPDVPPRIHALALLLIGASLALPVAAALTGAPFAHRYFNTSLMLLACGLMLPALAALHALALYRPVAASLCALSAATFLLAETLPFRPLYAAYRPFWLEYADADRAEPGRLNASWMEWGETLMIAGKRVETDCLASRLAVQAEHCDQLTLYHQGTGSWLPSPRMIKLAHWPRSGKGEIIASDRAYYLVSRLRAIQSLQQMPTLAPDFVVAHRGYVLAWAFRGDRLSASGFRLD